MNESQSTLLRFLSASDPVAMSMFISTLPFKVEIKGGPVQDTAGKWFIWFVLPDHAPREFGNADLG